MARDAKPIVLWPEAVLATPTTFDLNLFSSVALAGLFEDLVLSLSGSSIPGVGLAATQIGVPIRVAIAKRPDGRVLELVSPSITEPDGQPLRSAHAETMEEGCLSVPHEHHRVQRHNRVRVSYQDQAGRPHAEVAEGLLAQVLQHEVDHLNGIVFVDHLSSAKREAIRNRMLMRKEW